MYNWPVKNNQIYTEYWQFWWLRQTLSQYCKRVWKSVETFKTDIIVFICNVIMCFTSHHPITFSRRVISLKLDNITRRVQKKNVKITDKISYTSLFPTWVEKFLQYSGLGVEIDIYTIVDNLNNEGVHSNYVMDTTVYWLHSLFWIYDDLLYFIWNEW